MNEKYLLKLREDLRLKNFTKNTCDDYLRFTKRFLDFTGKEALSITYADIRKFIFHMKDHESQPCGLTTGSAGGLGEPLRGIFRKDPLSCSL